MCVYVVWRGCVLCVWCRACNVCMCGVCGVCVCACVFVCACMCVLCVLCGVRGVQGMYVCVCDVCVCRLVIYDEAGGKPCQSISTELGMVWTLDISAPTLERHLGTWQKARVERVTHLLLLAVLQL